MPIAANTKKTKGTQAASVKKTKTNGKRCSECWGAHPKHHAYCSWSIGSSAAKTNIVSPDYSNEKDAFVNMNGGYVGVARHVDDPWGTKKATKEHAPEAEDDVFAKDANIGNDNAEWVIIEGEWADV